MEEYTKLKRMDGYTDFSIKKIVVADFEVDDNCIDDLEWYKNKVLRHEIIHAFIYESGLAENCEWARDEQLTDWIAIQFENMLNVFIKLNIIKVPNEAPTLNLECNLNQDKLVELLNDNIKDLVHIGGDG